MSDLIPSDPLSVFKICIIVAMNNLMDNSLNEKNKSIKRIYDSLLANSWQQQTLNSKSIRVGYKIWVLAEAYGYVVHMNHIKVYRKENRLLLLLNED